MRPSSADRFSIVRSGQLVASPSVTISLVRIGTWNVDRERVRGTADQRRGILDALDLDVAVITEPGPWWDRPGVVSSPERPAIRQGLPCDSWVAVEATRCEPIDLEAGYGRMATAAQATVGGVSVVVYGSVLPWRGITEAGLLRPGEAYQQAFARLLCEQEADIRSLQAAHPEALVVWAGDFNQELAPPHYVGSAANRELLEQSLRRLGMVAWNAGEPAAQEEIRTIDLICGPASCEIKSIERIPHTVEGRTLSDHSGYVVELEVLALS